MQVARQKRWRESLPRLWRDHPGVVYGWLRGESTAWGRTPILDANGLQCATLPAVDEAVQQFWVHTVLRRHVATDGSACWSALLASEFGQHIPVVAWSRAPWTSSRVQQVLASMREAAAPGPLGIPLAVWKSMPEAWLAALAQMFQLVEEEGRWPTAWVRAYVTMIPKAAGGSRPEDQRPITVLDLPYRVWAKGIVLHWTPTLQKAYLGDAAMGFRAQSGTTHVVQLLQDLMALQRRRRKELWLASFDIKKCYDMLPWWALFGVARRAGVPEEIVRGFETFYHQLQRRFRYGQVDGAVWQAANGAAQGCPASPDLLNLLLEAFHRWARAAGYGVVVGSVSVPSVSYADDVALVARSLDEMKSLVAAYLRWCALLDLQVTKVQLWWNGREVQHMQVGDLAADTQPFFRMVGVVLGSPEDAATEMHLEKRLPKALETARRLQALRVPASLAAHLWRSTVLPQALYGCEVRHVTAKQLGPLVALGRSLLVKKAPLDLNCWRAPEVLMGPPLGDTSLRDPVWDMQVRQLRWLQLIANLPGLAGVVHRHVAFVNGKWWEPTAALRTALQAVGWRMARNPSCLRSPNWPQLLAEAAYPGEIRLQPVDDFPEENAVFTDGSVAVRGGAAVVQPDTDITLQRCIPTPRSSTHCELVALNLALSLAAPQIITDSLTSLRLIAGWSTYSTARILRCADRVEVRWFLQQAGASASVLEKVKAHDERGIELGHPKSLGNDRADSLAKEAAMQSYIPLLAEDLRPFEDPVLLLDASGRVLRDLMKELAAVDWRHRGSVSRRTRKLLDLLYPANVEIDWRSSGIIFQKPAVAASSFVHPAPPPVIKWLARLRAGCLTTQDRLHRQQLVQSTTCPCCAAPLEDDEHALLGCAATGTVDYLALFREAWAEAATATKAPAADPPAAWLEEHRWLLVAALIPTSISMIAGLQPGDRFRFCRRLHLSLAKQTAERLRRRQLFVAMEEARRRPLTPTPPTTLPPLAMVHRSATTLWITCRTPAITQGAAAAGGASPGGGGTGWGFLFVISSPRCVIYTSAPLVFTFALPLPGATAGPSP